MNQNQALKNSLMDLKRVTNASVEFALFDGNGILMLSTGQMKQVPADTVTRFFASGAEGQEMGEYHFFRVSVKLQPEYVLVAEGERAYLLGRIAATQLSHLIMAYSQQYDVNGFFQNLLLDNLLAVDIYNRATQLQVAVECSRAVIVIETEGKEDDGSLEMISSLMDTGDYTVTVDEHSIIVIKDMSREPELPVLEQAACMFRDMLNTEVMSKVRIGYGSIVKDVRDLPRSYKEARLALDVGKIFYSERTIISYSALGIGRLIYQLPMGLCRMFIEETFPDKTPDDLDEETLATIRKFFENDLNVSVTARQLYVHRNTMVYRLDKIQKATGLDVRSFEDAMTFKIALMVLNYMKYVNKVPPEGGAS